MSGMSALAPFATHLTAEGIGQVRYLAAGSLVDSVRTAAPIAPAPWRRQTPPVNPTTARLVSTAHQAGLRLGQLRQEWQNVAVCEVGGHWTMTGPVFSGIGFLNATWSAYGGRRFAPLAGEATRDEQILIAMRVTGGWVPDQDGCSTTGW
jgi:hypothetical protein